jgi:hypothetical protein
VRLCAIAGAFSCQHLSSMSLRNFAATINQRVGFSQMPRSTRRIVLCSGIRKQSLLVDFRIAAQTLIGIDENRGCDRVQDVLQGDTLWAFDR